MRVKEGPMYPTVCSSFRTKKCILYLLQKSFHLHCGISFGSCPINSYVRVAKRPLLFNGLLKTTYSHQFFHAETRKAQCTSPFFEISTPSTQNLSIDFFLFFFTVCTPPFPSVHTSFRPICTHSPSKFLPSLFFLFFFFPLFFSHCLEC